MIRKVNKPLESANNYAIILPITTLVVRTQPVLAIEHNFYETVDIADALVRYNRIINPSDAFVLEQTISDARKTNSRVKALVFAVVGSGIDLRTISADVIQSAYVEAMLLAGEWKFSDIGMSVSDFNFDSKEKEEFFKILDRFPIPIDLYL